MQLKGEVPAVGQQRQVKVLCIDNHASSNCASFLLRRCRYEVYCVKSIPDALDLIYRSSFDGYLSMAGITAKTFKEALWLRRTLLSAT